MINIKLIISNYLILFQYQHNKYTNYFLFPTFTLFVLLFVLELLLILFSTLGCVLFEEVLFTNLVFDFSVELLLSYLSFTFVTTFCFGFSTF